MAKKEFCADCVYCGFTGGCNYIFIEDKMRGCPPGEGCTKKKTNKDARREAKEERKRKAIERREKQRAERLMTVKCRVCGKEFQTTDPRRVNCSPECAKAGRLELMREYGRQYREKHPRD